MDELDRRLRDAALCLDICVAVLADLEHVQVLAAHDRAAVRALQLALLLERAEILADAILGHLEHLRKILDADLAVTREEIQDGFLTFFQKHLACTSCLWRVDDYLRLPVLLIHLVFQNHCTR